MELECFWEENLKKLKCESNTRAYIISTLSQFGKQSFDFSKDSLTIIYSKAKFSQDFGQFQNLADWLLMTRCVFPECLSGASSEYYITLGQLSYYSCFRLIKKQWRLFEELADSFEHLTSQINHLYLEGKIILTDDGMRQCVSPHKHEIVLY